MLYALLVGLLVFLIGNLFLAAQTAALIGFVVGLLVFFGFVGRGGSGA